MKVLFVNAPPLKKMGITGQIYPPLGILYLAAYARHKIPGLELQAIDGYMENLTVLVNKIISSSPDVLAVSFTTQAATGAFRLINEVKQRNKKIFIVAGGAHPTAAPNNCLENSNADLLVVGEGEETFVEIIERLGGSESDISNIAGTMFRRDGNIIVNPCRPLIEDLDQIPFPARDLLDIKRYPGYMYKKFNCDTDIISARGCPFNCVYCSNPVWKNQKPWYRLRSPQNVVDEIEHVVEQYGIREIFDQTDEFNGNKKWAQEVCDEIINRNLNIAWKAQMRVDNIDEELVRKLKKAGMWMALFGLESCNDVTLKGINKRQTLAQMERALELFKNSGIKCFGLFMAFNVWEENGKVCYEKKEESLKTLNYVRKLIREKKIHLFGWSMTTPYPGSKLYDIALKHQLIDQKLVGKWENFDSGSNFIMNLPGVSAADWSQVINMGKKLQAKLLFSSGAFNLKAFPLYMKKAYYVLKRNLINFYTRLVAKKL